MPGSGRPRYKSGTTRHHPNVDQCHSTFPQANGRTSRPRLGRRAGAPRHRRHARSSRHPFTLAGLAQIASCSLRSLQEGFRRYVGLTPMQYLRQIRLEHAHHDLAHAARPRFRAVPRQPSHPILSQRTRIHPGMPPPVLLICRDDCGGVPSAGHPTGPGPDRARPVRAARSVVVPVGWPG
ncbi:MAG: helix-turn-helix domain-containing protein [Pseudonocardiaceae bacterium]